MKQTIVPGADTCKSGHLQQKPVAEMRYWVMNISVKNAYRKLTKLCERVESLQKYDGSLKKFLAEDIYTFIHVLSKSGAERRYNYFNEIYQGGAYPSSDLVCHSTDDLPAVFCILNKFDSIKPNRKRVQTAGLFVSFISE